MEEIRKDILSRVGDRLVARANQLFLFQVHYRPYWLMSDLACLSALSYAWIFSRRFQTISGLSLTLALLTSLLVYKVVREVKASIGMAAARSFLQDCLLVIIPSFLLVIALCRQPMNLALAYLATVMPLYGSFVRIGCFLGGCCYGRLSSRGVLYPDSLFEQSNCRWRRYSPSPNPRSRVFPIQLLEASAQAVLFLILAARVWQNPGLASFIFWLYLFLYAVVRFTLDFARSTSARRRYWKFSEAQLTCIAVQIVSTIVLVYLLE
jgi:phosphatidylglycerol:prolipoprotein diacylglycerol transferase